MILPSDERRLRESPSPVEGTWHPDEEGSGARQVSFAGPSLTEQCRDPRLPLHIVQDGPRGPIGIATGGRVARRTGSGSGLRWLGTVPAMYPEWLGDRAFLDAHGVRFPYVAGEMAGGIAGAELVSAVARSGMLGFLGTGGLSPRNVERLLASLSSRLTSPATPWGANLLHTPQDPAWEDTVTDLYLRSGTRRVSCSAFLAITPNIVRYMATGLRLESGRIVRLNHVLAKVSRPEVAEPFLAPPAEHLLSDLVAAGALTEEEARLARHLPIAEDVTAEADSGGHTDNRPLSVILPALLALAERSARTHGYGTPVRIGAAGGLGTPTAVASAFALGAAYVLVGSVHQLSREAQLSSRAKDLLRQAGLADFVMAPSADMFEMGVRVQVLGRGTLFPQRATWLYRLYSTYGGLEELPDEVVARLEREVFRKPLATVWDETQTYFAQQNPSVLEKASRDGKYRMALVFRHYLGQTSRWARDGEADRTLDYQIWAGPAIGAFNDWVRGSFLADPKTCEAGQVALNLLEGACTITRLQALRALGVPIPADRFQPAPRRLL